MFTLCFLLNDVDTFQEGKVANIKKKWNKPPDEVVVFTLRD